jgi:hypothetical protein
VDPGQHLLAVGQVAQHQRDVLGAVPVTAHNLRYLAAKRDRLGHKIENLPPNGAVVTPGDSVQESA